MSTIKENFALKVVNCLVATVTIGANLILAPAGQTRNNRHYLTSKSTAVALPILYPSNGAREVCPDTPLSITFDQSVRKGGGKIDILDVGSGASVESIDISNPTSTKTIGGLDNFNYYPIIISGNRVSIYPKNDILDYGRIYQLRISPEAFVDETGRPIRTVSETTGWKFSTRTKRPNPNAERWVVDAAGHGDFASVQGAFDAIPEGNKTHRTIFIRKGTYTEILCLVGKDNITVQGEDRKATILAYSNNDKFNPKAGGNPFANGSVNPSQVTVESHGAIYRRGLFLGHRLHGFKLTNLTVHNTTPHGGSQAEAIILNGGLDANAEISNVDLLSFQDTLQVNGQAWIHDNYIEGDVDFLWGTGPSFFENCDLVALRDNAFYTQVRNPAGNHGFVFKNCRFKGSPRVTGNFLSRIDPGRFPASEVVLIDCTVSDAVTPVGWKLDVHNIPGNIRFWEFGSKDASGRPIDGSTRLSISRRLELPADLSIINNYSNKEFVLKSPAPEP